jgi:acyl-CoA thioester hydrolase
MPFHTTRRVEFSDTDMAGIAHFSCFFRYMEEAEHAFLRSLGLSVIMHDEEGPYGWPRVGASCDYQGPAKFEDVLDITVRVAHKGTKSLAYHFEITHQGRAVATGRLTAVLCRLKHGERPRSIPIPDWLGEKFEVDPTLPQP